MQTRTRIDDIDNQSIANYSYDLNGRLVSDVHDGVTEIKWSKSDKVLEVHKPNGVLTIKYNALDQKVSQSTSRNDSIVTEYFVYDPSGNVLASYGDTIKIQNFNVISHKFSLHQLTIYGSSRTAGLIEVDSLLWKDGSSNVVISNVYSQKLGLKRYELSNHLGNVSTVISDRKLVDSHSNGQITSYKADVVSVTDYYPFGMKITERSWNRLVSGVEPYRFGFNGKDFFSDWNRQDYGFRIYDPRKARFESVDPLHSSYPELSTYQFASNTPIMAIDLDGLEAVVSQTQEAGKTVIEVTVYFKVYKDNISHLSPDALNGIANYVREKSTIEVKKGQKIIGQVGLDPAYVETQASSSFLFRINPVFVMDDNTNPPVGYTGDIEISFQNKIYGKKDGIGEYIEQPEEIGHGEIGMFLSGVLQIQKNITGKELSNTVFHELGHILSLYHILKSQGSKEELKGFEAQLNKLLGAKVNNNFMKAQGIGEEIDPSQAVNISKSVQRGNNALREKQKEQSKTLKGIAKKARNEKN